MPSHSTLILNAAAFVFKSLAALGILLLVALHPGVAAGVALRLHTQMEALSGSGWSARDIDITLERSDTGSGSLHMAIARLTLPAPLPTLAAIQLGCTDLLLKSSQIRCPAGRFGAVIAGQTIAGHGEFDYRPIDATLSFAVPDLTLAQGRAAINGRLQADAWQVQVDAAELASEGLIGLLPTSLAGLFAQGQRAAGRWRCNAELSGQDRRLKQARWQLAGTGLTFAAQSGRYAGQDLNLQIQGDWRQGTFTTRLSATGQVYLQPLFLEWPAAQAPLTLELRGQHDGARWRLDDWTLLHPDVVQAHGSLLFDWGDTFRLRRLAIELREAVFPAAYERYLQPFVANTAVGDLATGGRLTGQAVFAENGLQRLRVNLNGMGIDDTQGRFGGQDLNGHIDWARDGDRRRSHLNWRSGHVYRLALGAAELTLETQGDDFRLPARTAIPVLDGALVLERLQGQGLGTDALRWQFDGSVSPISLEMLSTALQWPPLKGQVSGVIPEARYAGHRLTVGGTLAVRIFQGLISINDLRLDDPLGHIPRVFANLAIEDLDLLSLTQTFNFGKIEGKLAGRVRDLRLEDWQPVYFDAELATPPGDRSRRRISQRAVENIAALGGGGVTAALSRGVVGLFESFRYKRLGFRCRLVNAVCEMDGVAPAPNGYYLVEGGGLPRIDVIGYTRQVDWRELLARLKAAAQSEGPVVQ